MRRHNCCKCCITSSKTNFRNLMLHLGTSVLSCAHLEKRHYLFMKRSFGGSPTTSKTGKISRKKNASHHLLTVQLSLNACPGMSSLLTTLLHPDRPLWFLIESMRVLLWLSTRMIRSISLQPPSQHDFRTVPISFIARTSGK